MSANRKALAGVRVLDLTQVIMGPTATAVLADHGADVIKVERPGAGDLARAFGPFIGNESLSYISLNRNKRSVAIDLKSDAGRELARRLAGRSDVVINNFRPGVMERLGLGYEELRAINPGIIYATGTGFGTSGPLAERRKGGHDTVAQALTGAMAANIGPDGLPRKLPVAVADITAGNLLAQGILLALIARAATGEGQVVEVALLDAMTWMQAWQVSAVANPTGQPDHGANPLDGGVYETSDGCLVMTGLFSPNPLKEICDALGLEDLSRDQRFESVAAMTANAGELRAILAVPLRGKTTVEWIEILEAADILCAPVLTREQAAEHPQLLHNQMIVTAGGNGHEARRYVGVPVKLSATPGGVSTPAPSIGEDTAEVLRELGLVEREIAELAEAGVIHLGRAEGFSQLH